MNANQMSLVRGIKADHLREQLSHNTAAAASVIRVSAVSGGGGGGGG